MIRREFLGMVATTVLGTFACANEPISTTDIWLREDQKELLLTVLKKLQYIEHQVGHAKFNLISFDQVIKFAQTSPKISAFTPSELSYIDEVFHTDPSIYGFHGKRTCESLTSVINIKDVIKIQHTGHYLFREVSSDALKRIIKDVGSSVVLTSGVRSVVKQLTLHLDKIKSEEGNITLATRAIVPPAYSYHSSGDFDVGKKGWGHANFTANFARTQEFWSLQKLPYISMRYTVGNSDGVRFEPWHVKIV